MANPIFSGSTSFPFQTRIPTGKYAGILLASIINGIGIYILSMPNGSKQGAMGLLLGSCLAAFDLRGGVTQEPIHVLLERVLSSNNAEEEALKKALICAQKTILAGAAGFTLGWLVEGRLDCTPLPEGILAPFVFSSFGYYSSVELTKWCNLSQKESSNPQKRLN